MPRRSRTRSDSTRPLGADELQAYALSYLARFDCTATKLRQVLSRKLAKQHPLPSDGGPVASHAAGPADIERIVARFIELRYLDDERFARGLALSLFNRGMAPRKALQRLRQRGVDADLAEGVIRELRESGETELVAACRLVQRKRLGWCRAEDVRKEHAQKDLGALARAGFSFDVARRALSAAPDESE